MDNPSNLSDLSLETAVGRALRRVQLRFLGSILPAFRTQEPGGFGAAQYVAQ